MSSLSQILKDFRASGAMNSLVSVHAAVDDRAFLTKGGDLLTVLAVRGIDPECLDPGELDVITGRFERALRSLPESFRLYQYLCKRDHPPIARRAYDQPVLNKAVAQRAAYLEAKADRLYSIDLYFVLAYEGWHSAPTLKPQLLQKMVEPQQIRDLLGNLFSSKGSITLLEKQIEHARQVLLNKADSFVIQLQNTIRLQPLSKQDAFAFFRSLINFAPHKTNGIPLKYDEGVDYQACDSTLECYRDHLQLDDYRVELLTLKEPPAQTFANILQGLEHIPSNFILVSEWKRVDNGRMRRLIMRQRRHHHNLKTSLGSSLGPAPASPREILIDDAKEALVDELGACLEEIEVRGNFFGEYAMTLLIHDKSRERLKRSVAECCRVFSTHGAALTEERYNLVNAFAAVQPGNHRYNLRRLWLLHTNAADLAFLFAPSTGEAQNEHLGQECLAVIETNQHTPYCLNLHYQDLGHTLVVGASGSGKSFTLNFLLTHAQKYQPATYLFDLGGSYESLTNLFAGSYLRMGGDQRSFTINPFCLPPTSENLQFLSGFVRVLVESGRQYQLTESDERELFDQITNLYELGPAERRLSTLAAILPRALASYLHKWTQAGQYGAWFDNILDNLTLARWQAFDFEGMEKIPEVLEPLLFYVLHRTNAIVCDPQTATLFKIFVLDEAWRFLRNDSIQRYITEALKTWRKKNAAIILATQSVDDLLRSEMLSVVVESCASKLFLANPDMDRRAYREAFHLNERETELVARLMPKREMLLKRPNGSKVLQLEVDPVSYWLYTNSPYDNAKRREAFARYGFEKGLETLTRSIP